MLRDSPRAFNFLRADETPRADERRVHFGGVEDAARFLERVGASRRGALTLRELLGDGFATARLRDAEVPRILAPRFASGEFRVVEIQPGARLSIGMDEYVLLDHAEPPRRGESVRAFFSVEQAESFLQRMWDVPGGRRPLTDAMMRVLRAVAPSEPRAMIRDLAAQLVAGSVRLARIAPRL